MLFTQLIAPGVMRYLLAKQVDILQRYMSTFAVVHHCMNTSSAVEIRRQTGTVHSPKPLDCLLTLEALHTRDIQPQINTKDELRS